MTVVFDDEDPTTVNPKANDQAKNQQKRDQERVLKATANFKTAKGSSKFDGVAGVPKKTRVSKTESTTNTKRNPPTPGVSKTKSQAGSKPAGKGNSNQTVPDEITRKSAKAPGMKSR